MTRDLKEEMKMKEMSRRKFLVMSASSSLAAGIAVPIIGHAFPDDGLRRDCWNTIRDERTNPDGIIIDVPPEVEEAFPKLIIYDITPTGVPAPPLPAVGNCVNRQYVIENAGKIVASDVFVEMLEANRMTTEGDMALHPVNLNSECFRRDIVGPIVLHPGCVRGIALTFKREFAMGQSIAICYAGMKDPRRFPMGVGIGAPDNRKVSAHYHYTSAGEGTGGTPC